jgi:hypothetical protein
MIISNRFLLTNSPEAPLFTSISHRFAIIEHWQ